MATDPRRAIHRVLRALGPDQADVPVTCPHCGRRNSQHGSAARPGAMPEPGDVSLCLGCLRPGMYVTGPLGLGVRVPTADELAVIEADQRYREHLAVLRRAKEIKEQS